MPMNTTVPYLDVKNFFNPMESTASASDWEKIDNYEDGCVSCIEKAEVPAWRRTQVMSFLDWLKNKVA